MTRTRIRAEHGFTMIVVMGVMLIGMMLSAAAFAAVNNDLPLIRGAADRKQAYAAAEAGLDYYKFQLSRNNDFWTKCTNVPPPSPTESAPIMQRWTGSGTVPWRKVAGSDASYVIELLPAKGATCDPSQPEQTMLDQASGTFRIRSTGRSGRILRTITATFRRASFLDYLYFTDLETSDPQTYETQAERDRAQTDCSVPRASRPASCNEITFADQDAINGPFHTNDDLQTCGTPTFGRAGRQDKIEISGPASDGYTPICGNVTPDFQGTVVHPATKLTVPTNNTKLATLAQSGYSFTGTWKITLQNTMMTAKNLATNQSVTEPLPPNGVIYGNQGAGCTGIATPLVQNYADSKACAVLYVSGNASSSLTIDSAADIVIDGDITHDADVVVGLIGSNFVRVYHPVTPSPRAGADCTANASSSPLFPPGPDAEGALSSVRIDAAILSLQHSFIVDNYACGAKLGTVAVNGAIAQKYRGPVGTFDRSTGRGVTGYTKSYTYDDKLKFRSPPYFLDPVAAAWRIIRSNEQVPAVKLPYTGP